MRTDVRRAAIAAPGDVADVVALAADDLRSAGRIAELSFDAGSDKVKVTVDL